MVRRRPPIDGPLSGGRAGDVADPGEPEPRAIAPGEAIGWRVLRALLAATAVAAGVVVLVAGVWLWSSYRPSPTVSGAAIDGGAVAVSDEAARAGDVAVAYGQAWVVLGLAATAWLGVALVTSPASRRILATGALVALAGGALVAWTAPQLAWDQVAVFAVTAGSAGDDGAATKGTGLLVTGDEVRSYLVDGAEVSPGTQEALLAGHVFGASLVAIGLLSGGLLARARRRRPGDDVLATAR